MQSRRVGVMLVFACVLSVSAPMGANAATPTETAAKALASSAPYPGPGQDASELATERSVGDRAALSYASEQRGCNANAG